MKPTERFIQVALWENLVSSHELLIPNYTPNGWYECDLYGITKAGFAVEFEIKCTRADFKKDTTKEYHDRRANTIENKHARLGLGDARGPSRFFFVTPPGLIRQDEIPEWAGLLEVPTDRRCPRLHRRKEAPRLHKEAILKEAIPVDFMQTFYYRYWRDRRKAVHDKLLPLNYEELLKIDDMERHEAELLAKDVLTAESTARYQLREIATVLGCTELEALDALRKKLNIFD